MQVALYDRPHSMPSGSYPTRPWGLLNISDMVYWQYTNGTRIDLLGDTPVWALLVAAARIHHTHIMAHMCVGEIMSPEHLAAPTGFAVSVSTTPTLIDQNGVPITVNEEGPCVRTLFSVGEASTKFLYGLLSDDVRELMRAEDFETQVAAWRLFFSEKLRGAQERLFAEGARRKQAALALEQLAASINATS